MKHATPVPCAANCGRNLRRRGDSKSGLCWQCYLERKRSGSVAPTTFFTPTADNFEADGNSATITKTTSERVRTLEDLARVCEIDTREWEIERWKCGKHDVAMKPPATSEWVGVKGGREVPMFTRDSSEPITIELYQVVAYLKRKVNIIAARNEIRDLVEEAKKDIPARPWPRRKSKGCYALELSIPDLHLGKLAWKPETGYAHYDTKIAERLFEQALESLVERTAHIGEFDRILLPVGNDLLHVDNPNNQTTAGTQVDADSRFQKTFITCRKMLTKAIFRLRSIAPVDVYMVPGNHDTMATWHLGDSLECLFDKVDDVTIDNAPNRRKYFHYGANLIMLTHGDKGKRDDYPLLMATEKPELFGATKFREVHTGHHHQTKVQEYHGVRVRISPALCPPDAWHSENHFVGNVRGAEAYVWHLEEGLVMQAYFTAPESDN